MESTGIIFPHLPAPTHHTTARLGTISFLAVNAIALMQGISALPAAPSLAALRSALSPAALLPSAGAPLPTTLAFTALGALVTIALREASDDQQITDPVRAATVVGALRVRGASATKASLTGESIHAKNT